MHIGMTNAGGFHANEHVVIAGRGRGYLLQFERMSVLNQANCFHRSKHIVSGEHRLLACLRRQLADESRSDFSSGTFRLAAETNRLVACAPRKEMITLT